jgi:hypothetical protein
MRVFIRIQGHLDQSWQQWFEGLQIVQEEQGTTLFSGLLSDQAALYGVLLKIRNLGLTLLSLESDERLHHSNEACGKEPLLSKDKRAEVIKKGNPL